MIGMAGVRLVAWNPDLARERAQLLAEAGFEVDASPLNPASVIGYFRALQPAAVVIDLDRLPSHGREVGVALRQSKSTRLIPLVFVGGAPEKVARVRQELPDAVYCSWSNVARPLAKALRSAPLNPARPPAHMERYAGTSLVGKLGIKREMEIAVAGAPEGFEEQLGDLPEGARLVTRAGRKMQLALWFVRSRRELEAEVPYWAARLPEGCGLWIIHPKGASRYRTDFNQNDVRAAGLAVGLVDYKVCAVDADWTGLKFARRK